MSRLVRPGGDVYISADAMASRTTTVSVELHGKTLAFVVRSLLAPITWGRARALCERGKVRVDGALELDSARRLQAGDRIEVDPEAPVVRRHELSPDAVVHVDGEVIVVDKPPGLLSVPFDADDRDTLLDRARAFLRKHTRGGKRGAELHVVQRLDKDTTGVLVFARTLEAKRNLQQQWRGHTIERRYLAIAHGLVDPFRADTHLVEDRGDGLRGSWGHFRRPLSPPPPSARRAITEVERLETLRGASLVECRLHTGRQHQIRIHLSERGHPLVGEVVYVREYPGPRIGAPRVMLHARTLGFVHPRTRRPVRFEREPPADFARVVAELRPNQRRM